MMEKTILIITITVVALVVNFFFGLYNLGVTKRIKSLTKTQAVLILIINTMNTGNGLIHLLINTIIGAYRKN